MQEYATIEGEAEGFLEVERSKFLAYVKGVSTEEAAREYLAAIKKKHFDARHAPYAYVVGAAKDKQKSSDDGEPAGTSGMPILDVILKQGLTNIVVVVVRYFGGIKLGAGGLIRAYSKAAATGLQAAQKVVYKPLFEVRSLCEYSQYQKIEDWAKKEGLYQGETEFSDKVEMVFYTDRVEWLVGELTELTLGSATVSVGECTFRKISV